MARNDERSARIGRDFSFWQLIWFCVPAIMTNLFTALFRTLDDGLFVSRYVGPTALAAIKIIAPINSLLMGFSHLFSIGASTLSAHKMGEGDREEANRIFSRVVVSAGVVGAIFSAVVLSFEQPILTFLGADAETMPIALTYTRIIYADAAPHLMGLCMASYYSTAGKPVMGLVSSILNGSMNIIFDIILIVWLKLGADGAAYSTIFGEIAVMLLGFVFYSMRKHEIHFTRPQGRFIETTWNAWKAGFSQFIGSVSIGVTNYVTNITLISMLGSNGIAANSIINDLRMMFNTAFVGYAGCVGQIIAYNYGNRNPKRLKKILGYNLRFWFFGTVAVEILGQVLKKPLISIFIPNPEASPIYAMTLEGLTIEYFAVMFSAGYIFTMRMFVALGAPKYAAVLSTMRNFVFRLIMIIVLPRMFGEVGVWLAFPVAEFLSCLVAGTLIYLNRDNYGYGKSGVAYMMQGTPYPADEDDAALPEDPDGETAGSGSD